MVDASIAVEFLLQTVVGRHAAALMYPAALMAPELLDAEVLAVLRREVLARRLEEGRAAEALEDLLDWDVERIGHRELAIEAWALRHDATAYDALYLAAARLRGATVLTADGPLARIPVAGFTIQNLSTG